MGLNALKGKSLTGMTVCTEMLEITNSYPKGNPLRELRGCMLEME